MVLIDFLKKLWTIVDRLFEKIRGFHQIFKEIMDYSP